MKYRKRHARILAVMLTAVMLFSATGSFLTSATTVETGGFTEETEIMDSGSLGDAFAETEEGLFAFRNELPPEATPSKAEPPETAPAFITEKTGGWKQPPDA